MTSLDKGWLVRISYKTMVRSVPQLAKMLVSTWLNLTDWYESAPHSKEWIGSDRFSSHTLTVRPAVANTGSLRWCVNPIRAWSARYVWMGSLDDVVSQILTVLSVEHDRKWPLLEPAHTPCTIPLWPLVRHTVCCSDNFHNRISTIQHHHWVLFANIFPLYYNNIPPSPLPEITVFNWFGCLAIQYTPSMCPPIAPTNGLENMRSSFTAFNARTYSRPCWKGCAVGSRLRCTLWISCDRSRT